MGGTPGINMVGSVVATSRSNATGVATAASGAVATDKAALSRAGAAVIVTAGDNDSGGKLLNSKANELASRET